MVSKQLTSKQLTKDANMEKATDKIKRCEWCGTDPLYQKYHDELKSGKRTGVTEADMGGTECQKCHY